MPPLRRSEKLFRGYSLARVLAGRTSFVITHRLSTSRAADRILVIEKGKIIEQGTHRELLSGRGHYHDLYTEQSMRDVVGIDNVMEISDQRHNRVIGEA